MLLSVGKKEIQTKGGGIAPEQCGIVTVTTSIFLSF
jgi:hypothetical protein